MAGSYSHCVTVKDGKIVPREDVVGLLDHVGDAEEAIEEMLVMIDHLSGGDSRKIFEAHQEYLRRSGSRYSESFEKWWLFQCGKDE